MSRNFRVGIVGATGIAGQQFVVALQSHPWFTITRLAASERSAGKTFGQALLDPKTGARRWWCPEEPTAAVLALPVENGDAFDPDGIDVVFSATESDVAQAQEPRFATTTAVVSTASAFRYEPDVPLLVPNVNMEHAALIHRQQANRGWKGFSTSSTTSSPSSPRRGKRSRRNVARSSRNTPPRSVRPARE